MVLAASYEEVRLKLADEVLERVRRRSWQFFETLVVDVLVAMRYGGTREDATKAIRGRADEGIDGIIKQDPLGLDAVYVQAKLWKATVGRPEVQAFVGSLEGKRTGKGVFITTSKFSREAAGYVETIGKKVVLIDGERLAELMIEYGVGVAEIAPPYRRRKVGEDYFAEDE